MKNKLLFALAVTLLSTSAQAQYVNEYGVTDYGLAQDIIVNGTEVPSDRPVLHSVVAKIKVLIVARGKNVIDGPLQMGTCTGTLIAPDVILTAAHCMNEDQAEEGIAVTIKDKLYPVKSYVRHPKYKGFTYKQQLFRKVKEQPANDIALIFLDTKVQGTQPTLLPPPGARLAPTAEVILAGFGRTSANATDAGQSLRWVKVNVSEIDQSRFEITGDRTICSGDSGGPGLLLDGKRYMVVGVSSVSNCRALARMTRVSDYISWIQTEISKFRSRQDI